MTAEELIQGKVFELTKDSVLKITYKKPGGWSWSWGYVVRTLIPSLLVFARDRLYDEKTGRLIENEILEEYRKKLEGGKGQQV